VPLRDSVHHWLSRRVRVKRAAARGLDRGHRLARRLGVGNRYRLVTTTYRLSPPGWPDDLHLRAVVLADPHAGGSYVDTERVRLIVDRTNDLRPDLVLLLGDYGASHLEGATHRAAMRDLATELGRIEAPLGQVAVLGNHDWWDDPEAQERGHGPLIAEQELSSAGVVVLENRAVALSHHGKRFWVAGLGDQMARLGPPLTGVDDLAGLTARLPPGEPALLLAHEPDIFPEVGARFALTLSGHTHAGQIKIVGRTPVVPSRFGSRYVYGHVVEGGRHLVVSAGLGTSMVPVRLGTRPEIVELVLGGDPAHPEDGDRDR
jgi:predicted MPP superfamily phosphohydrolase